MHCIYLSCACSPILYVVLDWIVKFVVSMKPFGEIKLLLVQNVFRVITGDNSSDCLKDYFYSW